MVLDQQSTILRLLQLREDQGQLLNIEEGLLPLQDLPQLLSLEQRIQQSPDYKQKLVRYFLFLFFTIVCTITKVLIFFLNWYTN